MRQVTPISSGRSFRRFQWLMGRLCWSIRWPGLEVGTEIAWRYADEFKLPRFVVINRLDRDNANFAKALASVEEFSETRLIKVQLPIGEKHDFKGVVDLISMKAYLGDGKDRLRYSC